MKDNGVLIIVYYNCNYICKENMKLNIMHTQCSNLYNLETAVLFSLKWLVGKIML